MARTLCIHPWIYDFAAYNLWIEPLGLLTVAAALRHAGHEVSLVDCLDRHHPAAPAPRSPRDRYGRGQFAKVGIRKPAVLTHVPRRWGRYGLPLDVFDADLAAHPRPDAVLVTSAMTYWYPGPFEAIRRLKARWPGVPVALGGVYATLCAAHARRHSGADVVFTGPGERAAVAWVDEVAGPPARPRPVPGDVLPAHDLRRAESVRAQGVAVLTARGCPYHCPYCASALLSGGREGRRRHVPRSPDRVVAEIAWCVETLGARDVAFYDDALLVDAEAHIHPILDGILERGLRVRFHTPNGLHARLLDDVLARKMRLAGFRTIRLGLETTDPTQQARDRSKVDERVFARAVGALYGAGFTPQEVAAYVLAGRPGQEPEKVRETAAFAHALGVPVGVAQFSPIPGTAEWDVAVRMGCIAPDADPLLHNNSTYPCGRAPEWEALKNEVRAENRKLLEGAKQT